MVRVLGITFLFLFISLSAAEQIWLIKTGTMLMGDFILISKMGIRK